MNVEETDPMRVYVWAVRKVTALLDALWYQAMVELSKENGNEGN